MARARWSELPYATAAPVAPGTPPPTAGPGWLADLRDGALADLRERGLPTQRIEAWKYTSLNPLLSGNFRPASGPVPSDPAILAARTGDLMLPADADAHRLVLVNGRLAPALSDPGALPAGLRLEGLAEALEGDDAGWLADFLHGPDAEDDAILAVNTAFLADGVVLRLDDGVRLDRPVHIVSLAMPEEGAAAPAFHPRLIVLAGANSAATVIESHAGPADTAWWSNPVTELRLETGAEIRHYRQETGGAAAIHLGLARASLATGARLDSFLFAAGQGLARHETRVSLDGEGATCRLDSACLPGPAAHVDNTLVIGHRAPGCTSRVNAKGVLDGAARGVFQGRITVHRDAQKSDGQMMSRTLLLSDKAEIDTRPELEIFADDVKCGHGATAGEIDDDALFYLRSRGIGPDEARALLVAAFMQEVVDGVADETVRSRLRSRIEGWIGAHGGEARA